MADIKVTDKASKELLAVLKDQESKKIRLFIQGVGWGGPRLGLALDELKEMDETVLTNGIEIIFDRNEKDYLDNSVIDFEDSFMGSGFVVRSGLSGACWIAFSITVKLLENLK